MDKTFCLDIVPRETMTVGKLVAFLQAFDPDAPVVFQSPHVGCFGPEMFHTLGEVTVLSVDREETVHPACESVDPYTGELQREEAWVDVRLAWSGVVIR